MLVRLALGGKPMEANYGFNLAAGELPPEYVARFTTPSLWPDLLLRTILAFGALWLGVLGWKHSPFLRQTAWLYVVLVLLGTFLLSSRITRVIGVLYPVVIPGWLYLIDKKESP